MKKFTTLLFTFICLTTALFAYSDSDMDGVDDAVDKCPNTPLTDLVDINGCSKKKLTFQRSKSHYDIVAGIGYSGANYVTAPVTDTYYTSFQFDYYYDDFSLQASTSFYRTEGDSGYSDSGMNDTFLGAAYNFHPTEQFTLRLGAGFLLPTYDTSLNNNNTDYVASLNASYQLDKINLFAGYSYTMVKDDDVSITLSDGSRYIYTYKNTDAYSFGAGYSVTRAFYMSLAYNLTESIYTGVDDAKTASVYGYYGIDAHWFANFSYVHGLSDSASDHAGSLKIGYYF
jgi:hypothetical protein